MYLVGGCMKLDEALRHAFDGEAVLFLGAGFSYGGINAKGTSMKIGSDLSHEICKDLGIEESDNLTITSSRYIDDESCKKGLKAFIQFLKEEVTCIDTTEAQECICKLPWKRIYTTNYDNIVECATEKLGLRRETITITNERYIPLRNLEQAIVHINGYIKTVSEKNFYDEFKITDDNYNRDGLLQSEWKTLFLSDLSREKAIIFIGYSLQYDQELVRCISNLNVKDKCVFIDIASISDENAYKIKHYGELYTIGTEGIAQEIIEIEKNYIPQMKRIELVGFEKVNSNWYYTEDKYNSVDVVDLLVTGKLHRKYMNQPGYCVLRKETVDEICAELTNTNKKIAILQSKLGNGKTIFLECLANVLSREYDVYFLKSLENYVDDLQLIQSSVNKYSIVLIDDYGYYIKLLKDLSNSFPENMKIVLTCRTSININLYYDLIDKYGYTEEDIYVHDLDILKESEIKELMKVLSHNRLWGDADTANPYQKKRLIEKKYGANLSKVFYLLLDSKVIESQIKIVMQTLTEKEQLSDFVLAQAVNTLCSLKFTYSDLISFTKISETLLASYLLDQNVREIIDVSNHQFRLSSSIFSQYLVRQPELSGKMINCLENLYAECSERDELIGRYKQQRRFLVSRSNVKLAFSSNRRLEKDEEECMFKYYDSIKNLPTATDNPFFWLQFAITSLNLDNYSLAKIQFKNAYANAEKMDDFDSYQIDTHYARMLLCSEMKENRNNIQKAITVFHEAHKLLFENRNTGANLSYVLRQTSLYYEYFSLYRSYMTQEEINEYLDTAFKMCDRYLAYFNVKEIFRIPYDIARCYCVFRKLFE